MLKLKARIVECGLTCKYCAKEVGLQPETFSRKLSNPSKFTVEEVETLVQLLKIPYAEIAYYFFPNAVVI